MKKRILALLLCAALCFALLPAPALADENYNVWVAGTQVTSANMNDVLGATDGVGATVTYTPAVGTTPAVLTLNGANITGPAVEPLEDVSDSASGIYVSGGALTIHLIGANNVTKDGGSSWRNAIYSEAALTITAAKGASLTAEGKGGTDGNYGFSIKNSLTIEGGTITATGDAGSENATNGNHGICVVGGNLAITGGSVTAAAKGDATGDGSKSYGIFCDDGSINITNAIVNATGGSATTSSGGIWSENNLTIGNDATVTATGGEAAKTSTGLSCAEGGSIEIKGGTVIATGGDVGLGGNSYGIYGGGSGSVITFSGGVTVARAGMVDGEYVVSLPTPKVQDGPICYGSYRYAVYNINGNGYNNASSIIVLDNTKIAGAVGYKKITVPSYSC